LYDIKFHGDQPEVGEDAFAGVHSTCVAYIYPNKAWDGADVHGTWNGIQLEYVPGATGVKYTDASGHQPICLELGEELTRESIENVVAVREIVVGSTTTSIAQLAFDGCVSLEKIDLQNVQSIGESAFNGCTSLTNIKIPSTVASIGTHAFNGCTGLVEVMFDRRTLEEVKAMENYATWGVAESAIKVSE
jgi:hypothetical protein